MVISHGYRIWPSRGRVRHIRWILSAGFKYRVSSFRWHKWLRRVSSAGGVANQYSGAVAIKAGASPVPADISAGS